MDKFETFLFGALCGSLLFAVIISVIEIPPSDLRNEAVSAGVAEWVVSYDSNGSPVLEFRWKSENQKL